MMVVFKVCFRHQLCWCLDQDQAEYPEIAKKKAQNTLLPFPTSCLCELGFSASDHNQITEYTGHE